MKTQTPAAAAILIAALLASSPAAAINKCTIDGKTVYQQTACQDAKKIDLSGAGKADPTAPGATYWQRQIATQQRAESIQTAISARRVVIGMTAAEARQAWGQPTRINTTIGSYGKHEQWVYRRANGAQYVYIQNGEVSSLQSQD